LLSSISHYANIYFNIFIVILVVLFFDSLKNMHKYGEMHDELQIRPGHVVPPADAGAGVNLKYIRAQRNFYITGFTLFLFFVLRRLVTLISHQASMEANAEASRKQAESATNAARQLMEEQENKDNDKREDKEEAAKLTQLQSKLDNSQVKLVKAENELERVTRDLDVMKKQASATNNEYDRLLKEHATLQGKLQSLEGAGDKKSD